MLPQRLGRQAGAVVAEEVTAVTAGQDQDAKDGDREHGQIAGPEPRKATRQGQHLGLNNGKNAAIAHSVSSDR